jgi:signal peptidase II
MSDTPAKKSPSRHLRLQKLIKPRLQLKLVSSFVGVALLSMLLQFFLFSTNLLRLTSHLPFAEAYSEQIIGDMLYDTLLVSFSILVPLTIVIGVLFTHRIAGPVYRFERYLSDFAEGKESGPCRIRTGDELQELCGIINRAVERVRRESEAPSEESPSREPARLSA